MAARLIALPFRPVINLQGGIEPGAILEVFQSGTLTPVSIYSDEALTVELANPLTASGLGTFPPIYWDDATAIRVRLKQADGTLFPNGDFDPYTGTAFEAEAILDDATAQAAAAGVQATAAAASAVAAAASATSASDSATAAAASAATAILSPGTSATSTTSHSISTGTKVFFIEAAKAFSVGQFVIGVPDANPSLWIFGQIKSTSNITLGKLDIEVTGTSAVTGGPFVSWTIALSGPPGSVGSVDIISDTTGTLSVARGGTGADTASAARTNLGLGTMATQAASAVNITGGSLGGLSAVTLTGAGFLRTESGANAIAIRHDGTNGNITSTNALLIYANGANNIIFHTDAVARMRISATGDVGIGTASPTERLHVAGNIRDTLGNVRRIAKSSETSGTLTVASANQRIRAVGNITIPNSVFTAGDTVMIQNKSGGAITITQGSGLTLTDTSGATGNRTLANHGVATVVFDSASAADIFGAGLS